MTSASWLDELAEGSEMGRLTAAHPWAETPLGDPSTWPESLRLTVRLCLSTRFPMLITWGPDLIKIYNDGYRVFLGRDKHPGALGAPARDVWPEVWDEIGPLFESVRTTGVSTWAEHSLLLVDRNGYREECYFTFSYSPVHTDDGAIGGVLDIVTETTDQVVGQRRLESLRRLGATLVTSSNITDVCIRSVDALRASRADFPTVSIHLALGDQLAEVATNDPRVSFERVPDLDDLEGRPDAFVLDRSWTPGTPARRAAMAIGSDDHRGVLVVGLNPMRPFDDGYRDFVELIGRTISSALENAYRESVELGVQRHISDTLQHAMLEPAANFETVAARYVGAAGELSVGGDWYDIIDLGAGRRALVVGDCVGHGLEAATIMGQLRNASRALLLDGRGPAETLDSMDRFAASVPGALGATMTCCVVDVRRHLLTYASAGHPPPVLVRGGGSTLLEHGGVPLAVFVSDRTEATVPLERDDLLALYSDGLVERRGESIDLGLGRLQVALEQSPVGPIQAVADHVLEQLVGDRPRDDIALVVKRVP